jgi:hypothetical protein
VSDSNNTLLPPPRMSGNTDRDIAALHRYLTDLYYAFTLRTNVLGTLADHETRITTLEGP